MNEHFTCTACGNATNLDQYKEWGGAGMCRPCAQACERDAKVCDHTWEAYDGGAFCGKCSTVKRLREALKDLASRAQSHIARAALTDGAS